MSRSYKKHPVLKDNGKGAKSAKKQANRLFRRCSDRNIASGKSAYYRKYNDSWDIHDYVNRWTKSEAEADWEREEKLIKSGVADHFHTRLHQVFITKKRFMNYWEKCVKRK